MNYKLSLKNNVIETKDNAALEKEKALQKNKNVHDQNKAVKNHSYYYQYQELINRN
jgi:hypothetical protein